MTIKVTSKRQVTFPARVLTALGVRPGDRLELHEAEDGFLLRAKKIDRSRLAPLRDKLGRNRRPFDLTAFRGQKYDRSLRD